MRLIEIRLLDGPNLYRLEPAIKLEVALGRRRTWYGSRDPEPHALVRLGRRVPRREWPGRIATLVGWVARLRREHADAPGPIGVHRSSDPGHWIVEWPWAHDDRAREVAEAALALTERDLAPERGARRTPAQQRLLDRVARRVSEAGGDAPSWIRDADRRVPVVSISGTNGKTTTTRLTAHILRAAGRRVGATTSDGIVVGDRLVEKGDWTGPGGAAAILARDDLDVAVLETARGGILLRGIGYESNEASVITNVSPDHLDLQGIHTLPELAEVKGTICRITRRNGWVILNADDPHVAALARRVRAHVAYFSLLGDRSDRLRRHLAGGGSAYLVRGGVLGEMNGSSWSPIVPLTDVPVTLGGVARHNVANALAAAGASRAMGASLQDVARGLATFRPTTDASLGRLNIFRDDAAIVIVDFAHNEAGVGVLLDVANAVAEAHGTDGRRAELTAIVGLAGDRPDDTLRGVGRQVARRVDRFVLKEMLHYLRGRTRESILGEIRSGAREGGWSGEIPVYPDEVHALASELERVRRAAPDDNRPSTGTPVIVLLCHESRDEVLDLLRRRGLRPVEEPAELTALAWSR